jgi:hypothetical protein
MRRLIFLGMLVPISSFSAASASDPSIVDMINRSLQQEVQKTIKDVEAAKPVVKPGAKPAVKSSAVPSQDWLNQISQDYHITCYANQVQPLARIEWYLQHKQLLRQQLAQSRNVIFSLYQNLKKQGLPSELALVPLLTQASSLVLDQARLNALIAAKKQITDPLDQLAAYHLSINQFKQIRSQYPDKAFWLIPWPPRTVLFVANLVALAQLIQHADYYGLTQAATMNPSSAPVPPVFRPNPFEPLEQDANKVPSFKDLIDRIYGS